MEYSITLNFLPLNVHEFSMTVFRKPAKTEDKLWSEEVRKFWIDDMQYWVSFTSFEGSKQLEVNSKDMNIGLVNRYLHYLLSNKFSETKIQPNSKKSKFKPNRIYIDLQTLKAANGDVIGDRTVWLQPYFLQETNQFGYLIDYKFLQNKDYPFNREVQKHSLSLDQNYRQNKNHHIDKIEIINNFIQKHISVVAKLTNEILIKSKLIVIDAKTLRPKTYIFKDNKKANSQFNGVMNHGPFQKVQEDPNYYYIYKEEHKGFGQELVKALNGAFNTFKGLDKLHLPKQSKANTKGIIINEFSISEIDKILNEVKSYNVKNPIVIAVTPEKEEDFYFMLKHQCLKENIPVQTVHNETIRNPNTLKWSVGNIAIQLFSKLGGVPWIVEPSHENCLIVGLGQAHKYNREKRRYDRFFSYSVLVDSSGEFISIKQLADETQKSKFLEGISKSIGEIISENNTYRKIIFHIPDKMNKDEIGTIQRILENAIADIELSIIKINDKSDFLGFNFDKNSLVPYESSFVKLSRKQYLLWTEGLNFHNSKALKRYGNPLHIDFRYSNKQDNFENTIAYLQDILNLSGANYRGFNAKSLPVSSFYPKLIAGFSKHFKELNLQLITKDTKKPWFL